MNDESTIDRELRQALDVAPAPDFAARVRIRIASEPYSPTWFVARATRIAVAVAAAVVIAAFVLRPHEPIATRSADVVLPAPRTASPVLVVQGSSPAVTGSVPVVQGFSPAVTTSVLVVQGSSPAVTGSVPVVQGFSPAVIGQIPRRSATSKPARSWREPEVLVAQTERRGLRRLIALAGQGDPNLGVLLAPRQEPAPIIPLEHGDILIAPMTPLEPLATDSY